MNKFPLWETRNVFGVKETNNTGAPSSASVIIYVTGASQYITEIFGGRK